MLPLKRSAQEKKGTLAEKPFLCYYDIYRKERRENNEKLYSGNVSEETFCKGLISVILAVIVMGFALSWLVLVNFGTDPARA